MRRQCLGQRALQRVDIENEIGIKRRRDDETQRHTLIGQQKAIGLLSVVLEAGSTPRSKREGSSPDGGDRVLH